MGGFPAWAFHAVGRVVLVGIAHVVFSWVNPGLRRVGVQKTYRRGGGACERRSARSLRCIRDPAGWSGCRLMGRGVGGADVTDGGGNL